MSFRGLLPALAVASVVLPLHARPGQLLRSACENAGGIVVGVVEPVTLTSFPATFSLTVETVIKGSFPIDTMVTVT